MSNVAFIDGVVWNTLHFFPTNARITNRSSTCIDNIFTNYEGNYKTLVLNSLIYDHTAQKIEIELPAIEKNITEKIRIFNKRNKELFRSSLTSIDWSKLYNLPSKHINEQWNLFMNNICHHFNQHFPLVNKKIYKNKRGFINAPKIKKCKNELDILYVLKSKIECVTLLYNEKKKEYNKLLDECKNRHFSEKIKISSNKSKTTWSIIGEITGKYASKTKFNMNGKNNNIANNFNSFFSDSASDLLGNIGNVPFSTHIPYYRHNI